MMVSERMNGRTNVFLPFHSFCCNCCPRRGLVYSYPESKQAGMGCSGRKSPALSSSSKAHKSLHVWRLTVSCCSCWWWWGGVYRCQCSEGVGPAVLCRICCSSLQLCICPQVSSSLSACYDVSAALVRCLSVSGKVYSPSLPFCLSTCVSSCTGRGTSLSSLAPSHTHNPAPVLDPSLSHWALLLGSGLP